MYSGCGRCGVVVLVVSKLHDLVVHIIEMLLRYSSEYTNVCACDHTSPEARRSKQEMVMSPVSEHRCCIMCIPAGAIVFYTL